MPRGLAAGADPMVDLVLFARLLAALALLACPALADVLVVGPGQFPDIDAALATAVDGDVVLVEAGQYPAFVIDDLDVAVVAANGAHVSVGGATVRNLAVPRGAQLMNLEVGVAGIEVVDCRGPVRIQGCGIGLHAPGGASVSRSLAVTLVGCAFTGWVPFGQPGPRPGMNLEDSNVAAYRCTFEGSYEGGAAGVELLASSLFAASCVFRGSDGSDAPGGSQCQIVGDGGNGLTAVASSVVDVDCTYLPGYGGWSSNCLPNLGEHGVARELDETSTYKRFPVEPGRLLASSLVADTDMISVVAHGEPGDLVQLYAGTEADFTPVLPRVGVQHVDPTAASVLTLGTITPLGSLHASISLPALAPGVTNEVWHLQVVVSDAAGQSELGAPFDVVRVDRPPTPDAARLFVDSGTAPGGDGLSWATAYNELWQALDFIRAGTRLGTEVWIAEGTYLPRVVAYDPSAFRVPPYTRLYGGFAGSETSLDQRDPDAHPTVLSGDQQGNDGPAHQNPYDNSNIVVDVIESALLDGVTVIGSRWGNGIRVLGGTLILNDCEVRGNHGGWLAGAGVHCAAGTHLLASDTDFVDNYLTNFYRDFGGGALGVGQSAHVVNCRFAENFTYMPGGAVLIPRHATGELTFAGCTFVGNYGGLGGAIGSFPSEGRLGIVGCTFFRNEALSGGALFLTSSETALFNSILWDNTGDGVQGEIGQLYAPGPLEVAYSNVQGWTGALGGQGNRGVDPMFVDPRGADGMLGTADDDLRLRYQSPLIDAGLNGAQPPDRLDLDGDGDSTELLPFDLTGRPRFVDMRLILDPRAGLGAVCDIGAYERAEPQSP